jgi:hypothetical protein
MSLMRIAESFAQTRGLDEYRQLDQAERAQAHRVAAELATKDIETQHKEVEETHRTVEQKNEDDRGRGEQHAHGGHPEQDEPKEKKEHSPAPLESAEGHLIDFTA